MVCDGMQVFYDLAPVCPIFPGLPAPDIPKLENGCKRVIKQWQDTGMLAKAGRTGTWASWAEPLRVANRACQEPRSILVVY